jgi:S1-C subfamily serine protease
VEPASPAEIAGLQGGDLPIVIAGEEFLMGGDIIYEINGQPLRDPVQLDNFLDSLKIGDTIRFSVYRAGKRSEVELAVSERPPPPGRFPDQGN